MPQPANLTPLELKARLDNGDDLLIVDVRNPDEFARCRIPGSTLVPLPELPHRLAELDPEREIVVHCKMGGRSLQAANFLAQKGYARVFNLTGGIAAWIREVDPTQPAP